MTPLALLYVFGIVLLLWEIIYFIGVVISRHKPKVRHAFLKFKARYSPVLKTSRRLLKGTEDEQTNIE